MKILHTADIHLGDLTGPVRDGKNARRQDTIACMKYIAQRAATETPNVTIIAGDLFNRSRVWADTALDDVNDAITEFIRPLCRSSEHVVLLFGTENHDNPRAFETVREITKDEKNLHIYTAPGVEKLTTSAGPVQILALPGFDKGRLRLFCPGADKETENRNATALINDVLLGLSTELDKSIPSILVAHYTVAGSEADRREDVAPLAVLVLDERDESGAVRVVLQAEDLRGGVHLVALEVDDAVLPAVAAALVADGDAAVAVAAGVLFPDLYETLLGLGVLIDSVEAGHAHLAPCGGRGPVSFNRHLSYPPLHHALEELDALGVLAQLHDGLLPGLRVALRVRASALLLAAHRGGGDADDLHAEDLLNGLLYLDLIGILSDLKGILLDVEVLHRLLGDDGADDDIVRGGHQANTSSIFCSAALSTTSTRLLRIS